MNGGHITFTDLNHISHSLIYSCMNMIRLGSALHMHLSEGLQCVAVCCSVLQCVAVRCSVLQCAAVCCSVLQCVALCCSVLQGVAGCCNEGRLLVQVFLAHERGAFGQCC